MSRLAVVAVIAALAGCFPPYHPPVQRPFVYTPETDEDLRSLGPGVWWTAVYGNRGSSRTRLVGIFHDRAAMICRGPPSEVAIDGETIGSETRTAFGYSYLGALVSRSSTGSAYNVVSGAIRCADAPVPPGAGCARDTDCKGDRVCTDGKCVNQS